MARRAAASWRRAPGFCPGPETFCDGVEWVGWVAGWAGAECQERGSALPRESSREPDLTEEGGSEEPSGYKLSGCFGHPPRLGSCTSTRWRSRAPRRAPRSGPPRSRSSPQARGALCATSPRPGQRARGGSNRWAPPQRRRTAFRRPGGAAAGGEGAAAAGKRRAGACPHLGHSCLRGGLSCRAGGCRPQPRATWR